MTVKISYMKNRLFPKAERNCKFCESLQEEGEQQEIGSNFSSSNYDNAGMLISAR